MSSGMTRPQSRLDWLASVAESVRFRGDTTTLAPDLVKLAGTEATAAALVSGAAARHAGGQLLDQIVRWVISGRLLTADATPDPLVDAIGAYRDCSMPGDWWNPDSLHDVLLVNWASRARSVADDEVVAATLGDRWKISAESVDAIFTALEAPPPVAVTVERWRVRDAAIARLLAMDKTVAALGEAVERLSPLGQASEALCDFVRGRALFSIARELLAIGEREPDLVPPATLSDFAADVERALHAWFEALTPFELDLVRIHDDDVALLREYAADVERMKLIVAMGNGLAMSNGVSDRVEDVTLAADWLVDEIFSGGARSGVFSYGPLPYIWIAYEPHELPADGVPQFGIAHVENDGAAPVSLAVVLEDDQGGLHMDYGLGHSPATRAWLAMLLLSRRLMLDVFVIDPDSGVRLVERFAPSVTDLADSVAPRALETLRAADPVRTFPGTSLDEHTIAGFMASDNAKSELLLDIGSAMSDEVGTARLALLDAEVARAWRVYADVDTTASEQATMDARRVYGDALARSRRRANDVKGDEPEQWLAELVGDAATDSRALVHYNFHSGHLEGFWVADGGAEWGWLECRELDIERLGAALKPWLIGGERDLDELLDAARPLAEDLDRAFTGTVITELVLMPWALLHGVPFGALELGGGRLDDRYVVSYAPSVAVLRRALDPDRCLADGVRLIAAHGGTLPWAEAEISAAAALHPDALVVPDGAPRDDALAALHGGRLVHVATHGRRYLNDHFASALDLRDDDPLERYVPAAEIHRDFDLSGTELVLLAACETGRAPAAGRGIELYSGLDGAFLAQGARAVVSTMWPVRDFAAFVFMTSMHVELATGASVGSAFRTSVALLRDESLASLSIDRPVAAALEAGGLDWRKEAASIDLRRAEHWAAFQLSGAHWAARPL